MYNLQSLLELLARLRDPAKGDPWHQRQNFSTIAPYTIEEAYEVADAIERRHMPDLCTELGDLLFQVLYHSQLAAEAGHFTLADVLTALECKLQERSWRAGEGGDGNWQQHKLEQRRAGSDQGGLLDHVPLNLPALGRAQKLQANAATAGFDWNTTQAVLEKVAEEFRELGSAMQVVHNPAAITHELGDILFVLVNLARHLNVDAESALRSANRRFEHRFRYIEERLRARNLTPSQVGLEELERLWQEAKTVE